LYTVYSFFRVFSSTAALRAAESNEKISPVGEIGNPDQAVSVSAPCTTAGRRAAACFDHLHVLKAFAEALVMHDFTLAQKVQRLNDLAVVRHVHQVLVRRARFLFGCTLRCATFCGF
jgi:hypothetical protein